MENGNKSNPEILQSKLIKAQEELKDLTHENTRLKLYVFNLENSYETSYNLNTSFRKHLEDEMLGARLKIFTVPFIFSFGMLASEAIRDKPWYNPFVIVVITAILVVIARIFFGIKKLKELEKINAEVKEHEDSKKMSTM